MAQSASNDSQWLIYEGFIQVLESQLQKVSIYMSTSF